MPSATTIISALRGHNGGRWRTTPLQLVIGVAFLSAVGAFVLSTVAAMSRLGEVSTRSQAISTDMMPMVIALTTLRERIGEVLREETAAVDAGSPMLPDIDRHLVEIQRQSAAYEEHAHEPGQSAAWARVQGLVDAVVARSKRVRTDLGDNRVESARSDIDIGLRPAVAAADVALADLVRANAMEGETFAHDIERTRHGATLLLFGLDGACVFFAFFLAVVAVRAARLVEVRSNELLDFAGRVAHDVRGPLWPVGMALGVLRGEIAPEAPAQAVIDRAERSIRRVCTLIDDLLAFARAGGPVDRSARADVLSATRAVLDDVSVRASSSGIELSVDAPDRSLAAACPPGVLTSLLTNLVENAVKYIGGGKLRRITVRVVALAGRVRIEVADTGPGLPPGAERQVFEPYTRADRAGQPGLGLGLATVKRLATAYGGAVGVASGDGGSTFWFELRRATGP